MSQEQQGARSGIVSPRGMAVAAAAIAVLFGAAHLFGLGAYTAILSGTAPPGAGGAEATALGLAYAGLYFAFVIGAPILAIAAAVMWGLRAIGRARERYHE